MAIVLPYLNIFDTDGCPCQQQPALILPPNDFQNAPAHTSPRTHDLTLRIWIALLHLYSIRDLPLIVLEHEQAEAASAGLPTPITSSPPSIRWWPGNEKDGQVTLVGVVYCERVNRCLQQRGT